MSCREYIYTTEHLSTTAAHDYLFGEMTNRRTWSRSHVSGTPACIQVNVWPILAAAVMG